MRDPHIERSRRAREAWQREEADRESVLELLRQSRETANENYVVEAAGFWLARLAPDSQSVSA